MFKFCLSFFIETNYLAFSECFLCPVGYFKCPGSFCLENRFVCDGEMNCQNGEDEVDCGRFNLISI